MRTALALLLTACSFDPSGFGTDHSAIDAPPGGLVIDAASPAPADGAPPTAFDAPPTPMPPDAACSAPWIDLCSAAPPAGPLTIAGADVLNTDTDPRCRTYPQAGGPDACLVYVQLFSIPAGASLTAVGSRPLIVASIGDLDIDGLLDVSSQRGVKSGAGANYPGCSAGDLPQDDAGGAAGGAAGSFGGPGANGGTGDTDASLGFDGNAAPGLAGAASGAPTFVRGGCAGQSGGDEGFAGGAGGAGGDSGGAVFLFSFGTVQIGATAVIRATGAGGGGGAVQAGGGGGGSGGFIGLEGASVTVDGQLWSDGGGGGGGGARVSGSPVSGGPGSDGAAGAASGGAPAYDAGGGQGSADPQLPTDGGSSIVGAGGGGGAAGVYSVLLMTE